MREAGLTLPEGPCAALSLGLHRAAALHTYAGGERSPTYLVAAHYSTSRQIPCLPFTEHARSLLLIPV